MDARSKNLPAGLTTVLLSGAIHFLKPPRSGDVGSTPGLPGIRLGISFLTCVSDLRGHTPSQQLLW
jgi:hypothetical protein